MRGRKGWGVREREERGREGKGKERGKRVGESERRDSVEKVVSKGMERKEDRKSEEGKCWKEKG